MEFSESCSGHLYDVLEVQPTASMTEIRQQYRKKALQYHPDKHMGMPLEAFQEIEEAHRILHDSKTRLLYDCLGRETMKKVENNPMVEALLANLSYTVSIILLFDFFVGCALFGSILGLWRFDRQFATWAKGSGESFSWWWVGLFLFPTVLLSSCISGVVAKVTFMVEQHRRLALCQLAWCVLPVLFLVVGVCFLNGTIGFPLPFLLLTLSMGVNLYHLHLTANMEMEENPPFQVERPPTFAVKRKAILHLLFLIFLLVRILQSGPRFLSCWVLAAPLLLDCLWEIFASFSVGRGAILKIGSVLYTLLLWTQKLNVELNGTNGFEPRAWVCSLPQIVIQIVIFLLVLIVGMKGRSFLSSSHYDA